MGFSDNVLDRVMKKHGIENREGFIAHASSFDDDDNGYLNERELTNAAEAWGEDSDASEEESHDDDDDDDDDLNNEDVSLEEAEVTDESSEDENAATDETIVEDETTDSKQSSDGEDDMMDAMMDKLMADTFSTEESSDDVAIMDEAPPAADATPIECPICKEICPPGTATCPTCNYRFL